MPRNNAKRGTTGSALGCETTCSASFRRDLHLANCEYRSANVGSESAAPFDISPGSVMDLVTTISFRCSEGVPPSSGPAVTDRRYKDSKDIIGRVYEYFLSDLFAGCKAGLVFVTAFENRRTMQTFVAHIAWESEVWIAEDPNHMIHFNGKRFLGPYSDVMPPNQ